MVFLVSSLTTFVDLDPILVNLDCIDFQVLAVAYLKKFTLLVTKQRE